MISLISSWQHFRGLRVKGFPTDSRLSNRHKLCPSPSRHISALIRSRIHTVFALNWKEKVSISVQVHRQIHRWRNCQSIIQIFENYLGQIYPAELEIKDTMESNNSSFYLDLLLSIRRDDQLHTSLYNKRDNFNFHITNFRFLSTNIPSSPAYGVFISAHTVCQGLLLLWMFYSKGGPTFI